MIRSKRTTWLTLACAVLALAPALVLTPAFAAHGGVGGPGSCGRGESMAGVFLSRDRTPGGGAFLTIEQYGSTVSVNVSEGVFAAAGSLAPGTRVRLVAHAVRNPMSGAGGQPAYDCIERAG